MVNNKNEQAKPKDEEKKPTQKKEEPLSSDDVLNAHAAGDGASGRSKEAITEEDVHPKKEDDKKEDAPNY